MRIVRKNTKKLYLYTSLFGLILSASSISLGAYFSTQTASAHSTDAFVMEIDTRKVSEANTIFVVPTAGGGYNYTVDCDDTGPMSPATGQTGDSICEYDTAGVYTVAITGTFPQVQFGKYLYTLIDSYDNASQLLSVKQWGSQQWRSMNEAFSGAQNLQITAQDVPDLSNVTSMSRMFSDARYFNGDLSSWNVSNVTDMNYMFAGAIKFNGDLSSWNVSNVTDMSGLFYYARVFNQPLSSWNVSNVTNMSEMFSLAYVFNQPLSSWNVSNVTNMSGMFMTAHQFNQSLASWNIFNLGDVGGMLMLSGLSPHNYEATLRGWAARAVQPGLTLDSAGLLYCDTTARDALISAPHNWVIDGDMHCDDRYITGVTFSPPQDDQLTMTVRGQGFVGLVEGEDASEFFASHSAAYGYPLLRLNNQVVKACLDPSVFDEGDDPSLFLEYYSGYTLGAPCYRAMDTEGEVSISDTRLIILLPEGFETTAPGTVSINNSPEFTFNTTEQPLSPVDTTTSVATAFRTATLQVADGECANINAPQTQLLAPSTVTAPTDITILGGVGFELTCTENGGSTNVSLRLGAEYADTSVLSAYKDLAGDGTLTPADVAFVNKNGATYVEFPLTDGLTDTTTGLVDEDGAANGRIVDPLYIGIQTDAAETEQNDGNGAIAPVNATPPSGLVPGAPNTGFEQMIENFRQLPVGVYGAISVVIVAAVSASVITVRQKLNI